MMGFPGAVLNGVLAEYRLANALDAGSGAGRVAGQQHDELVATPAADQIAGTRIHLQPHCELLEQMVTSQVAVDVIDRFESVQVEHEDTKGLLVGDVPLYGLFSASPAGDAGKLIFQDEVFGLLQFGLVSGDLGP